jgi:hypothetical protein
MAPVEVLKERPDGTDGLISQEVMVPPLTLGVLVVIAVPFVRFMFSGEYTKSYGATCCDESEIEVE